MMSKKTKWIAGILLVIAAITFAFSVYSQIGAVKEAFEKGKKVGYEECMKKKSAKASSEAASNVRPSTLPKLVVDPKRPFTMIGDLVH
ncbi:MAG: hypothetical protein V1928_02740 [Parcubacteria group bacterium]